MASKPFQILYKENPDPNESAALRDGILEEVKIIGIKPDFQDFGLFIKDEKGEVVGGIDGTSFHGSLVVSNLWVKAAYRKTGMGKRLVEEAENLAKRRGCSFVLISTFDFFGVLPFYKKMGYEVEWTREGYDQGATRYYLKKNV